MAILARHLTEVLHEVYAILKEFKDRIPAPSRVRRVLNYSDLMKRQILKSWKHLC